MERCNGAIHCKKGTEDHAGSDTPWAQGPANCTCYPLAMLGQSVILLHSAPIHFQPIRSPCRSQFKIIFYWEYVHRLLGRFIGLFFLIPLIYFYFTFKLFIALFFEDFYIRY